MASKVYRTALITLISSLLVHALFAQTIRYVSDLDQVLRNLDSIDSPGLFRSSFGENAKPLEVTAKAPRLELKPAETLITYNLTFPYGNNDGALWQGVGVNAMLRAGAELSWAWGSLTVQPEWWVAQNLAYPMAPSAGATPYQDYWYDLDRLQAFGSAAYNSFSFGQSELRLEYSGFTLGFGTKNHKFGPAEIQNLLLSDNASGFPMLDIGTDGPYRTAYGAFDARLFWGQTSTSGFYNADGSIDRRLLTGGLVSYAAPFLPGMSFGFQRVFHSPWATMDAWKVFQFFDDTVWKWSRTLDNSTDLVADDIDQILSFTWEWRVPQTGSRAYVEWGRNDHAGDLSDFLMQPDHSMGYVAGLQQKVIFAPDAQILISFEIADIGNTIGTTLRPTGSWYRHPATFGGYTNDGQLLGAYMGPGSNMQELDIYYRGSSFFAGLGLQRWIFDADYYYQPGVNRGSSQNYNLLLSASLRAGIALERLEFGGSITYNDNLNRNFIQANTMINVHLELSAKAKL